MSPWEEVKGRLASGHATPALRLPALPGKSAHWRFHRHHRCTRKPSTQVCLPLSTAASHETRHMLTFVLGFNPVNMPTLVVLLNARGSQLGHATSCSVKMYCTSAAETATAEQHV